MVDKRNIVMITLDSVRADHCSFMGYHRKTTPTIDKMARKGLYFENAIASGPGTPVSLVGVFTGDYANVSGTNPQPWRELLKQRKTLAQVLVNMGYTTGAFNPNPFVSSYFGFNKGFRYFQDFVFTESEVIIHKIYKKIFEKVAKSGKRGLASTLRNIKNLIFKEEIFKPWESFYDDIINWVERAKEPFFLWILLLDTHHPYLAPRKYRRWSNLFDMWYYNYKLQKEKWMPNFSEKEKQKLINAYDDAIYYADNFIKKLWNDLKDYDPIFIIHADHGEAFGEHDNIYGHGPFLYEEFIHVPLVIYNADVRGKIEDPVSLLSISPTILELIDLKTENIFPSKNILNREDCWIISKIIFDEKMQKWRIAVRMKDWKYIEGQKNEQELYNLRRDPNEQRNVIYEYIDIAKEIKNIVKQHLKQGNEKRRIRESILKLKKRRTV